VDARLETAARVESFHQFRGYPTGRTRGDCEAFGDGLVGETLRQQAQRLRLLRRQAFQLVAGDVSPERTAELVNTDGASMPVPTTREASRPVIEDAVCDLANVYASFRRLGGT
jgi:hypothetical protein